MFLIFCNYNNLYGYYITSIPSHSPICPLSTFHKLPCLIRPLLAVNLAHFFFLHTSVWLYNPMELLLHLDYIGYRPRPFTNPSLAKCSLHKVSTVEPIQILIQYSINLGIEPLPWLLEIVFSRTILSTFYIVTKMDMWLLFDKFFIFLSIKTYKKPPSSKYFLTKRGWIHLNSLI